MAYPVEQRAAAIGAQLLGASKLGLHRDTGIARSTLGRWMNKRTPKKTEDDLVLEYLREGLAALRYHARFSTSEAWLMKQSGQDLSLMHGVLADKCARIYAQLAQRTNANGAGPDLEGTATAGDVPGSPGD